MPGNTQVHCNHMCTIWHDYHLAADFKKCKSFYTKACRHSAKLHYHWVEWPLLNKMDGSSDWSDTMRSNNTLLIFQVIFSSVVIYFAHSFLRCPDCRWSNRGTALSHDTYYFLDEPITVNRRTLSIEEFYRDCWGAFDRQS